MEEDTLVCNEEIILDPLAGIGYLADNDRGRLYFVQLDQAGTAQNIRVHVPKRAVAEENNVIAMKSEKRPKSRIYYAYSGGRMNGSFVDFSKAVQAAYEGMGLVTDENGYVYWVRVNRSDTKMKMCIRDRSWAVPRFHYHSEDKGLQV